MPSGSPPPDPAACRRGAERLVDRCARVRSGERVAVIAEQDTLAVAEYLADEIRQRTEHLRLDVVRPLAIHGAPPPAQVGATFAWADVLFGLTRSSMAHTAERKRATDRGARYLSLPDYSLEQLAAPSLAFDFGSAVPVARRLKQTLDRGRRVRVTTEAGTDVQFVIEGRTANATPGVCWEPGSLGSPPDAETHIAPVEGTAEGVVVVDGSIPCREIGLLASPVRLTIRAGAIAAAEGPAAATLNAVLDRVGRPEARYLAEFGVGLNPEAQLTGRMLDDEGCAGTIHFGFGSNATIGGRTSVPFHLDFVVRSPSVWVDGELVMDRGGRCGEWA
jgi:leucyl aminopeptidase (aminopeptidase T)